MGLRNRKQKNQKPPTQVLNDFPAGVFLETEKGYFWVRDETKRLRFISKRVLNSWSPQRIIQASEADPAVSKLRIWAKMQFRDGSLLYCHANGKMYLISGHKRRYIANLLALESLGATVHDVVWVSQDEINLHEDGEPIK